MSRIRMSSPWVASLVRFADGLCIGLAGILLINFYQALGMQIESHSNFSSHYGLISVAALLFAALPAGVYRSWRGAEIPVMLGEVAARWLGLLGLILVWKFIFDTSHNISPVWFVMWAAAAMLIMWMDRLCIYLFLRALRRRGFNLRHVALVGTGPAAENIKQSLASAAWSGYHIAITIAGANTSELSRLAEINVDEVWLALPLGQESAIKDSLHALRHSTVTVRFVPDLFALRLINHGMTEVVGIPMYDLSASPMAGKNQVVKWLEDKVLSSLILLLICPLMIILALGVKLSSPGPVFYRQERVGLNNKRFLMLKFRSMPIDAEKFGVKWGGSAAKATNWFGKFIRRTSLDELPQFLNVLKGDMSIVGPRPERPMFVDIFKEEIPDYMKKHMVKAGITGLAQVHGWRGDTDLCRRIEYDLFYIENWSIWLDLKIIVMTVFRGFVNKNAY